MSRQLESAGSSAARQQAHLANCRLLAKLPDTAAGDGDAEGQYDRTLPQLPGKSLSGTNSNAADLASSRRRG